MATGPNPLGLPISNTNPLTKNLPVKKPATRHGHDFLPEPVPARPGEQACGRAGGRARAGARARRRGMRSLAGGRASVRGACVAAGTGGRARAA